MTILTIEQYEATRGLLRLLGKLIRPKSLKKLDAFIEDEHNDWTPCDHCAEMISDCCCEHDAPNYRAEYDDEASF